MMAKYLHIVDEKQLEGNDLAAHSLCKSGHWYKPRQLHCLTKSWLQSDLLSKKIPVKGIAEVNGMHFEICAELKHISLIALQAIVSLQPLQSCNLRGYSTRKHSTSSG